MNIRERFEEIWPVPDVILWSQDIGRYAPMPDEVLQYERLNEQWAHEHNARLDTFTRCQETTDVYVSLIQEMVDELSSEPYPGSWYFRAQKLLEQNK